MANSAFGLNSGGAAGIGSGAIVQSVKTVSGTPSNSAGATIPIATTPQITDGAALTSVTITPTLASNTILVKFYCPVTAHSGTGATVFSLFKVGNASALTSTSNSSTAGNVDSATLEYSYTATSTAAVSFQVRYGVNPGSGAGASAYVLQSDAGAYTYGGALQYILSATEISTAGIGGGGGGVVPVNPAAPSFSEARSAGAASGTGGFVNGTYTTPAGVTSLVVTLVGAGGGGASGINAQPTDSTFSTRFGYLTAFGGGPGLYDIANGGSPAGGAGGTSAGATNGTTTTGKPGTAAGVGGAGFLGAGAGGNAYPGGNNGGGGGAGGIILEETINAPAATYTYYVGVSQNWNGYYLGQNGCILVTEKY